MQLACDATQEAAVGRLRRGKVREKKPFALMARDLEMVRRYCDLTDTEAALLASPAAPIVILPRAGGCAVADSVRRTSGPWGFMLPNTPLHHLLLRELDRPLVLTSGNRSDEPQWIDNVEATRHLGTMATAFLLHDRGIAQRVDDSIAAVIRGTPRLLRRGRGYAPAAIPLPRGLEGAPAVLAMGGELKNTFCLSANGRAILSHHIGDLEDALTLTDYRRALQHYRELFAHVPEWIAVDRHPEYLSSKLGRAMAAERRLPLYEIQHHHAHLAACLAENGIPLDHPPMLGIALDGLGYGEDGTLWGGEFCRVDYRACLRVGMFKPVRMLSSEQAIKEPWRNTYAHLIAAMGWEELTNRFERLELYRFLATKPRGVLDQMLRNGINSPLASSCGRLFDAVAAAAGIRREAVSYEGQAAVELEQLVDAQTLAQESGYPFAIRDGSPSGLPSLEPLPMWQALLEDLLHGRPASVIAARFHLGLAQALCLMVGHLMPTDSQPAQGPAWSRYPAACSRTASCSTW